MEEIILFGGSFDPIHNEHIKVALEASKHKNAKVWFLLAKSPAWKNDVTLEEDRFVMLSLALKKYDNLIPSDFELKLNKSTTYTIETVYELKNAFPDIKFYYLIGADQLDKLHMWKDIEELKDLVSFLCVNRDGYIINEENKELFGVEVLDIHGKSTSSTKIRNNASKDIPKVVQNYIIKNNVYLKEDVKKLMSEKRYVHTLNVARLAKEIAEAIGYDYKEAYIAGLVHDCSKELNKDEELRLMNELASEHLHESKQIYHQYTAPYIAKTVLNIQNKSILEAIRVHTTGKTNMSTLDKIIYIADKCEIGRNYDSSFYINKAKENINVGFAYLYLENLRFQSSLGINPLKNKESQDLYKECSEILEKYQLKTIVKLLDDKAAYDIKILDMKEHSPMSSYCIICESNSERQAKAYASLIEDELAKNNFSIHHIEGRKDNQWILVDAFDIIIHIFTKEGRRNYNLDKLWVNLDEISVEEVLNYEL
jgi:nicotinate-nucleotide adenylyltransferase